MTSRKMLRAYEWHMNYMETRQRILRLTEQKLMIKSKKSRSKLKKLLMVNVEWYITSEMRWEELQSDSSDSEDDRWSDSGDDRFRFRFRYFIQHKHV